MVAHTGSRRCNSSTTSSTARPRTRPPTSSAAAAMASKRPSPPTNGKARQAISRRRDTEVVSRKMEALRRLVPSGGGDEANELSSILLRAAGYIARLQAQVTVMQLMVDVLEHTED
ncbi:hypothetical protein SEVIR_7G280800v4 [Setaria viridis]|uniref:BHLH domain-containing protein n=3 Tax=Setaria TaxID=4554 RepID=A0A368S080_SETIT|nr:transcription factor bHLH83-like [Setaria italica]XP_034605694.1 transcription factor bHLH83-like [Setaria viridis]RCV35801.1 hypothetical protein SETIT_7G269300v2 [Setaria italica]TKW07033.1 hypothetical protein SEVIR_7G280800v2 [Setaria viridis]